MAQHTIKRNTIQITKQDCNMTRKEELEILLPSILNNIKIVATIGGYNTLNNACKDTIGQLNNLTELFAEYKNINNKKVKHN